MANKYYTPQQKPGKKLYFVDMQTDPGTYTMGAKKIVVTPEKAAANRKRIANSKKK